LIGGFAVGTSSSLFPAAKLWLGLIGLLLIVFSFSVLGLHHLRSRERHPRKLYGHERTSPIAPANRSLALPVDVVLD
jgi:hypothetical protein